MKKTLIGITILLILVLIGTCLFACVPKKTDPLDAPDLPEEDRLVLFLGDSIGEAVAGPTPVTEREAYGYYGIIGNTNGYTYYNRSVSGYTSGNLASLVKRSDDGVNMVESLITAADVIHISILGNDFLYHNHGEMMIQLSKGNYEIINRIKKNAAKNLDTIITTIREKNPDAVLILQTLYNPTGPNSPLIPQFARTEIAKNGIDEEGYHELMDLMIKEINAILYTYLEEHTVINDLGEKVAPFVLADVYSAMEEIYRTDRSRWDRLFCADGIHPLNEGHALISCTLQDKLQELGLASPNALKRYKKLKIEQMNRLYASSADLTAGEKAIRNATDFGGVTEAYFSAVNGKAPHYESLPTLSGKRFTQEKYFKVDFADVYGTNLMTFINNDYSYVRFDEKGYFEIYLDIKGELLSLLKEYIGQGSGLNVNRLLPIDFNEITPYFGNIAPGVDPSDLEEILRTVEYLYGISLDGLDYTNPALQKVFRHYRETGEILFDDPNAIGSYLAFRYVGMYRLEEVTNPSTGEVYKVIYMNNLVGVGEPFLRFTMTEKEGKEHIRMTIDVIRLETEATLSN